MWIWTCLPFWLLLKQLPDLPALNAKSPVSHGDMATRQSQMFCLSNCWQRVPGSKLYLGPTVHHCSAIVLWKNHWCWYVLMQKLPQHCHWMSLVHNDWFMRLLFFRDWFNPQSISHSLLAALAHSVSIVKFRISHDMEQHINIFPYVHDDGIFIYSMIMWHLLDMFSIREAHISYFQGKRERERESRYTRPGFCFGLRYPGPAQGRLPRPKVSDSPANRERELLKSVREENFVQILGQCGELKS